MRADLYQSLTRAPPRQNSRAFKATASSSLGGWRHLCTRQDSGNPVALISQKQFTASRHAAEGRRRVTPQKSESAGMKTVCRVILPQSGKITILRRWNARKLQSIERRNARPTTIAARGHSLYNSYPLHRRPTNCQIIRSMEENYEVQSKVIHLTRVGADHHRARRIRFKRGS